MVSSLASCLMCLHVVIRGRRSSIYDIVLFSSWGVFPKIHMEMEREVQGELVAPESPATVRTLHFLSSSGSIRNRCVKLEKNM